MQWVTINSKNPKGQDNQPDHNGHAHRDGLKGRCMHPLFGAGVATTILLAGFLTFKLIS